MGKVELVPFLVVFCLAGEQPEPRLVIAAEYHDFAQIDAGSTVSCRYRIGNAGKADLSLGNPRPQCGCTTAFLGRAVLGPGESTELEVTFRPGWAAGDFRKTIELTSNDPLTPTRTLSFHAYVRADVTPSPDSVFFQNLVRGDRLTESVRLSSKSGHPVRPSRLEWPRSPWLRASVRNDGNDLWVDFQMRAGKLPPGRLAGTDTARIYLADLRPAVVEIPVRWQQRSPVNVDPGLVLWQEPAGKTLEATVALSHRERRPFRILRARTSSPFLQVQGLSPVAAVRQDLHLRLLANAPVGNHDEKVFITLDTPGHPELTILVCASLR
jgi:hypothetical protein